MPLAFWEGDADLDEEVEREAAMETVREREAVREKDTVRKVDGLAETLAVTVA